LIEQQVEVRMHRSWQHYNEEEKKERNKHFRNFIEKRKKKREE
jgi:hypothetical protein